MKTCQLSVGQGELWKTWAVNHATIMLLSCPVNVAIARRKVITLPGNITHLEVNFPEILGDGY